MLMPRRRSISGATSSATPAPSSSSSSSSFFILMLLCLFPILLLLGVLSLTTISATTSSRILFLGTPVEAFQRQPSYYSRQAFLLNTGTTKRRSNCALFVAKEAASSSLDSSSSSNPKKAVLAASARRRTGTKTVSADGANGQRRVNQQPYNKNKNNNRSNARNSNKNENGASSVSQQQRSFNRALTNCETAKELLQVLSKTLGVNSNSNALTLRASGGALNSVNFSTSFHRLARHSLNSGKDGRASVLTDPRFALLLACLAEAMAEHLKNKKMNSRNDSNQIDFQSREFSNIGWALAKLKLAPPATVMPLATIALEDDDHEDRAIENLESSLSDLLETKAQLVRQQVLQVAAQRRQSSTSSEQQELQQLWIPALSQLAGHILDVISYQVLTHSTTTTTTTTTNEQQRRQGQRPYEMQEYANLLWAWATAGRANPLVFDSVLQSMMQRQRKMIQEQRTIADTTTDNRSASSSEQLQKVLRPQEWSNSIWACATAHLYTKSQQDVLVFVAELFSTYGSFFVDQFKTQELSNTIWGVATLLSISNNKEQQDSTFSSSLNNGEAAALSIVRVVAQSLVRRADEFRSQELSNTAWALATVGFGLTPSADQKMNNYIVLASDQPAQDYQLMQASVEAIALAALRILPRFRSQELNNLAWAFARLVDHKQQRDNKIIQDVLKGIGLQLCDRKRPVTTQDCSTSLWSLATLGFVDADIYRGIVSRLGPKYVQRAKPQELSNTLWSLATADVVELIPEDLDAFDTTMIPSSDRPDVRDPITLVFGLAALELMRRPFDFKPQEMKDVLWSFSRMGIRHPRLFKAMAEHLIGNEDETSTGVRGFDGFSPQGLGNMAWAYARQAQLAADAPDRRKSSSSIGQGNGRQAVHTASYFDVGEVLIQRLFRAIAKAAVLNHDNLRNLKPQDLSNSAWTYAVLGLKHEGFMETAMSELRRRVDQFLSGDSRTMNYFKGQELANLIWALATLNIPSGDLLEAMVPYFTKICQDENGRVTPASIAGIFKRQELANIAWSCAVFGTFPKELMQLLYTGLVGIGDQQVPSILADAHGDTGLQSQLIMSMIYVQAVMDLEGKSQSLKLPNDFPDGWQQDGQDPMTETNNELNLSTSNVQRSVSSAFARIGFDHVQEHVITMEEMVDHGISFAPKPLEILSIDIANLQDKIAIEVDGPAHFVSKIDESVGSNAGHTRLVNGKLEYQFRWNGDRQSINGPTALKQRLLSLLGWKVIHLPFWEWYALGADEAAQEDFCRRLLEEQQKTTS